MSTIFLFSFLIVVALGWFKFLNLEEKRIQVEAARRAEAYENQKDMETN